MNSACITKPARGTHSSPLLAGVIGFKEVMRVIGRFLGLVWFIAFGGFVILNFMPNEDKPELATIYAEKFEAFLQWFLSPLLVFCFFIAMWRFVSFKLGKDSGWKNLATVFAENYVGPSNSKFVTGSGYIGNISHNGMLKVSADEVGFYIKAMFPFSFGHKPLQIPWNEISCLKEEKALVSSNTPNLIKSIAASFTRKKYMKIELQAHPDQNIVIHWEDEFNKYVPSTVHREP